MNDPITLLSGFRALVSVWSTGHMTTRWLTHGQDGGGVMGEWRGRGGGGGGVQTLG